MTNTHFVNNSITWHLVLTLVSGHHQVTIQEYECILKLNIVRLISFTNFNAQFLYSLTTRMLHYNPGHVLSINMSIFRRTNCIITASGIVTLCKQLYSMPDESRQSLFSSGILYCTVQRVTIPDAVIIQFVLLKIGMLMLETCLGL